MDLHFVNDFPIYKIAMEMNMSEFTVKRHFKKALIKTFEYLKATNREYFSKILSAEQTLAIIEAWSTYQDVDKIINFLVGFANKGMFRDYTLNELKRLVLSNKPQKQEVLNA